jgi:hypothetical protein|tara:strand:- start:361 stop:807 length:447 start_codon:yes stop_codon:yes gene_type:complete
MSRVEDDIKSLGGNAKFLRDTFEKKIFPRFQQQPEKLQSEKWGDMLDDFHLAGKQLDDIMNEMHPVYAMHIPVPRKVPDITAPNAKITQPIATILSTMIPKEDVSGVVLQPDHKTFDTEPSRMYVRRWGSARISSLCILFRPGRDICH